MIRVDRRIEVPDQKDPDYAGFEMDADEIATGRHRSFVGGRWDEIGEHQLRYMIGSGLTPDKRLLDVGCGSLRAGRHFVEFLEPRNYYGVDINPALIEAGYEHELTDDQREKLPIGNLRATDRFDVDFGVKVDVAIANSVFTHVSLNYIRLCLCRLAEVLRPGAKFHATFFEQTEGFPLDGTFGKPPKRRFQERNVYWYYADDLAWCASKLPFDTDYVGDWGHPRDQRMMVFTRR